MIVIDSSALVEAFTSAKPIEALMDCIGEAGSWHAPHLLDAEFTHAVRGVLLGGKIAEQTAEEARELYVSVRIVRYEMFGYLDRVWDLRHNFAAYDATYVALAEALDAPLVTCDDKLVSDRHNAEVLLFKR
jgi:predicted nucleic acid-binding protein